MTQQQKEQKIAYYLYKKGAKPNSSIFIQTEEVARDTDIVLSEVSEMFGNPKYFEFSTYRTPVGLILTKEGVDFVESKNKRFINDSRKWGTFIAAVISAVWVIIQFFSRK